MNFPESVQIIEVSPRDGLQNEKQTVPTEVKFELIQGLIDAGINKLEATSFVSPKWVPQMGDNSELMQLINQSRNSDVCYSVLTPNMRGFENALSFSPDEVVIFGSASETFSQKNINCSIDESIERFAPVAAAAKEAGIKVRGVISCTVGCPYEGEIAPSQVAYVTKRLVEIGAEHIGVADTIGVGTPIKVQNALKAAMDYIDIKDISGHFHDTYGQALANILTSLSMGVAQYDTSVAGLGGCPYAKGATGNVATEDVIYMLHGMGIKTGVDLDKLIHVGQKISDFLGRANGSRTAKALLAKQSS
ncbi:hydroxymethylglutaryl-CoA lyase [Psychrobacter sp. FDAARGOS_221]|uniref:hydroxymethylglutaryl-CoA lyase n=1 Tax=Psychrobacter sp. FDAARGOS_221 TaxID=1975705 RepID=UPI000BB54FD1|nr:hydroxymethylglutaryl-CoA lyase [Psychrobacter sp. FDAARGOS_221]PNK61096.1 hydroxymethylglutaryl-CoA lyase [Psychrobacter sp. FDAARGOS_221]